MGVVRMYVLWMYIVGSYVGMGWHESRGGPNFTAGVGVRGDNEVSGVAWGVFLVCVGGIWLICWMAD